MELRFTESRSELYLKDKGEKVSFEGGRVSPAIYWAVIETKGKLC